jgi:cytoskeletal protein CcmA (bactofilin family)
MFGKKTEEGLGQLETVIGPDTTLHGMIATKGTVRIDGTFEGNITEANGVIIGATGKVQGDINATTVIIGGTVTGNITALHSLEILAKAHVCGDLHSEVLCIGEGATFEGNCVMTGEKNKLINIETETRRRADTGV